MDSDRLDDNIFDVNDGVVTIFHPIPNPHTEDDTTSAEIIENDNDGAGQKMMTPLNRDLPSSFRS